MDRKKCVECPFNPSSPFFSMLEGWKAEIVDATCDIEVVGCHMIPDAQSVSPTTGGMTTQPDPRLQCVGHREYVDSLFPPARLGLTDSRCPEEGVSRVG